MAYVLPTFNLTCNIWHYGTWFGNFPAIIPVPDLTSSCNLALGKRVAESVASFMWLLLPPLTDIRDPLKSPASGQGDIVEVPAGSGRYYYCEFVDDAGKGFANEHRVASIMHANLAFTFLPDWPVPYP